MIRYFPCYDKENVHLPPTFSGACGSSTPPILTTFLLLMRDLVCPDLPYYATSILSDNSDALSAKSAQTGISRRITAYLEGDL